MNRRQSRSLSMALYQNGFSSEEEEEEEGGYINACFSVEKAAANNVNTAAVEGHRDASDKDIDDPLKRDPEGNGSGLENGGQWAVSYTNYLAIADSKEEVCGHETSDVQVSTKPDIESRLEYVQSSNGSSPQNDLTIRKAMDFDATRKSSGSSFTLIQTPTYGFQLVSPPKQSDRIQSEYEDMSQYLGDPQYRPKVTPRSVPELKRSKSQIERLKALQIPTDSNIGRLARQISGRHEASYDVETTDGGGAPTGKRPKSYFDLAVFTLCCCFSLLGCAAIFLSVLSDANYKANHTEKARKYGKISLALCIVGMVSSVAIAIALLLSLAVPWEDYDNPPL